MSALVLFKLNATVDGAITLTFGVKNSKNLQELVTIQQVKQLLEDLRSSKSVVNCGTISFEGIGPQRTRIVDYVEMFVSSYESHFGIR